MKTVLYYSCWMIRCNNTLTILPQLLYEILARSESQFTIFLSYKQSLHSIYKDRYFVFIFILGYSSLSDIILFSALKSPFLSCKYTRRYNGYSTIYFHISSGRPTQKILVCTYQIFVHSPPIHAIKM